MALINEHGMSVSYESEDLIEDLKRDILEFGEDEILYVWTKEIHGVKIYVNYDFIVDEAPVSPNEIEKDETLTTMKAKDLLRMLEKQNEII